jgi:hypothetical protein
LNNEFYFQSPKFPVGTPIPELSDISFNEEFYYDTFGLGSLRLLNNKHKFDIMPLHVYHEESSHQDQTLGHEIDNEYMKGMKYKSHHLCNSSAWYKIIKDIHVDISTLDFSDINSIKNVVMMNVFLELYPHKNKTYYDEYKTKSEYVLEHIKNQKLDVDKIRLLIKTYTNILTEQL